MAVEIPKDLITKLQISLRHQANVPSYDPDDSSLPTLPSQFPHSISISDSPGLHCLHCKAPLLRGSDSLLCIFCGKFRTNSEAPRQPIKFKSTSGYRWFLQSLNLDGSEYVGESVEGNESSRGTREEFRVSDLLDLEIRWNDAELEKFESGFRKNNPLNLAGLDLNDDDDNNDDDFLAERKGDSVTSVTSVTSQGAFAANKSTDSTVSNVFGLRENLHPSENIEGSKSCGSSSGWQADFQPADSRTDDNGVNSKSLDPSLGSSENISSHMDMVFGQGTNLFDGKEKGNQTSLESKANDWFQGDVQSTSISGVKIEKEDISSSRNIDWIQGDQAQISAINALGKETTIDDDADPFDAWNDFKGSTNIQDDAHRSGDQTADGLTTMPVEGSSADLSTHMDSVFGTGKDSYQGKAIDNTTSSQNTNCFQDDIWTPSVTLHHAGQSNVNVGVKGEGMLGNLDKSFLSVNRTQDDQWPAFSNEVTDNRTNDEDDSFGAWNDFKSSRVLISSISLRKEPIDKEPATNTSSAEEHIEPFSGWATDFQAANSKNMHEESKSSDPFMCSSINLSENMDTVFASGKNLVGAEAKDGSNASNANSWFGDDAWNNSTSKIHQDEKSDSSVDVVDSGAAQNVHNSPSMIVDWFPDDHWLTGNRKKPDGKTVDESDDYLGDWSNFKSSTTKQDAFSNSWKEVTRPDNQIVDDSDDLSAAWNDFTSLTSAKDSSSVSANHEKPSIKTAEVHLFSMDSSLPDNNYGSFSHPDFFSGAFSNQNGSTGINVMQHETPVSDRVADANARGGCNNVEVAKDGEFSSATLGPKTDDIEILMSQMHDLSFMLESNLSMPSKVEGSN